MVMDESTKLLSDPEFEDIRRLREAAKRGDNSELAKESTFGRCVQGASNQNQYGATCPNEDHHEEPDAGKEAREL